MRTNRHSHAYWFGVWFGVCLGRVVGVILTVAGLTLVAFAVWALARG